jgi:uracil phosphoribosyltransferase
MKNIIVIKHPLVEHKLTHLRKEETSSKEFKEYLDEISSLMAYEVLKETKLHEVEIKTPVASAIGKEIDEQITIYPILRAGIGMAEGFTKMLPAIKVGHIGMYRDPKTLKPIEYLFKYPHGVENGRNIIIDPMIATGGSAELAIQKLKDKGMKNISFVALVAAKDSIEELASKHSDIIFYVASIDPILNDHGYIEPGLGDAGDRIFGTK